MKVQGLGFHPVPIGAEKKPPSWFSWTDYRDGKKPGLTIYEIETLFANPEVGRVGIILNKRSFLIDYDGALGKQMLWSEVIPSCSVELQRLLRSTAHTKTPHGGHILVLLDPNAFPEGVEEILCWQLLVNGHEDGNAEIRILSQNKYSIEYGMGYVPVIDIQEVVTLSKENSIELVELCRRFKSESTAIRNIAKLLTTFWIKGRRQSLAFAISGYLYKNKVAINFTRRLVLYLAQLTNDEEEGMRLDAVNRTYAKDVEEVSGLSMLMELIDENESIIQMMRQQFSKLGYSFHDADGNGDARTHTRRNTGGDQDRDSEDKKLSAVVIELLEPHIELLFKNRTDDRAFASIHVNGHREIIPIHKSRRFDLWVRKTCYDETGDTLGSDVLKEVVDTLGAKALFDGPEKTLDLRISKDPQDDSTYWYDLCNENWEAIRITRDGWNIVKSGEVPIMFRRYSSQQAQVYPSKNYPPDIMDQFLALINLKDSENDRLLVKCYIVSILIPGIAKAILMIHGPKGAAKTALEDLVKQLLDPSILGNLTLPRTTEQLVQQLMHTFLTYYDNVSILPEWLSNDLCRAVTGTASSKRELYTDDDDIIYQYKRPIGFNGINLAATRPDLLDRGLIIELERIKPENRRSFEQDIKPELERIKPELLGFILDIVVKVLELKSRGGIKLKSMSRMADFEIACEMISRCLGYDDGEFIKAYDENKGLGTSEVLEGSPVAGAIIHMMESRDTWSGTATILLSELEVEAAKLKIDIQKDKSWPKAAHILSRRLNEIKPNLEELNIFMHTTQDPKTRLRTIVLCKIASEALEASESSDSRSKQVDFANATANATKSNHEVTSDRNTENHVQNQDANGANASNATSQTSLDEEQETDPSLAGTTKLLNNLREDNDEYQCTNCLYKEVIWKNNPKPKFCPRCKNPSKEG
jgi:hypothetical protein